MSKQVKELSLVNKKDFEIFQFAKNNNFSIVTFDVDFFDLSNLYGQPPKIIWLKTKNQTTKNIEKLICTKQSLILEFLNGDFACLELVDN